MFALLSEPATAPVTHTQARHCSCSTHTSGFLNECCRVVRSHDDSPPVIKNMSVSVTASVCVCVCVSILDSHLLMTLSAGRRRSLCLIYERGQGSVLQQHNTCGNGSKGGEDGKRRWKRALKNKIGFRRESESVPGSAEPIGLTLVL